MDVELTKMGGYVALVEEVIASIREARPRFDLALGIPRTNVITELKEKAAEAIMEDHNSYSPAGGLMGLRESVREFYCGTNGSHCAPIITSGTGAAITIALLAIAVPGDEILLLEPYFIQHRMLIEQLGMRAILVPCKDGFGFSLDTIRELLTSKSRALLFSNPCNPTGRIYNKEELRQLDELSNNAGISIISDEIYRFMAFDATDHPVLSLLSLSDRHFVASGFSKSHSAAGWRIGFLFAPAKYIGRLTLLHHTFYSCAPTPLQVAFQKSDLTGSRSDLRTVAGNSLHVAQRMALAGFHVIQPQAGYFIFPKLPIGLCDLEFFRRALDVGIAVLPGRLFSSSNDYIRISLAMDTARTDDAIELLAGLV